MKELDLRNTKIYVNGKSKELQEKLFKMGSTRTTATSGTSPTTNVNV